MPASERSATAPPLVVLPTVVGLPLLAALIDTPNVGSVETRLIAPLFVGLPIVVGPPLAALIWTPVCGSSSVMPASERSATAPPLVELPTVVGLPLLAALIDTPKIGSVETRLIAPLFVGLPI